MLNKFCVLKRTTFIFTISFAVLAVHKKTHAVADFGNPGVLPQGRYQMTFRFGNTSEIQDKFNSQGTLQSPSRMNKRFDNKFLMSQPKFQGFAKILDEQILPSQKPSVKIDPGSVEFKGNAQVDYFVPQLARGMTKNWSLGFGIPLVRYKSDISMQNRGINTAPGVLKGAASPEKFKDLSKSMAAEAQALIDGPSALVANQLRENNFRSISERDERFMGDIVLGSSLKLYDSKSVDLYMLNNLTLPTGPKDDPDDMIDLNIFGKTQLQNVFFANLETYKWLELGVGVFYTWGIPDDFEKRVPESENDFIPRESSKETVRKDPGDAVGAQFYSQVKLSDYYQIGAGYEVARKQADKYRGGNPSSRYDLLEKDTDSNYQIAKFKFTYSTVDGFLRDEVKIPYSITYAFADHISGKNVERELTHEFLMKFYF